MDDQFIREHIEILLRTIRTKVLIKLIKPYTKIRIEFIAQELNIAVVLTANATMANKSDKKYFLKKKKPIENNFKTAPRRKLLEIPVYSRTKVKTSSKILDNF